MDPLQSRNSTEKLDVILEQMDPLVLQGYKKVIHEVIIQGISFHDLNCDTLFHFNKDVMDKICQKAVSY